MKLRALSRISLLIASVWTTNQLSAATFAVTSTDTASTLVNALIGAGITVVGTPTLTSKSGQSGLFSDFTTGPYTNPITGVSGNYAINNGLILTSGLASQATGNYSGGASNNVGGTGYAPLSALIGGASTFDADVLTFQFMSTQSTIYFNYAFASTEYPVYVNSAYNDVFGFFVNGTAPSNNIALIPGTTTPVSINNVNVGNPVGTGASHPEYFTKYSTSATPFNYGGITTMFMVSANVSTTSVNTITLAIADASDGVLDSAVLLQSGTFSVNPTTTPEPGTLALLGTGLGLIVMARKRRSRRPPINY